jgi:hypothetical protein
MKRSAPRSSRNVCCIRITRTSWLRHDSDLRSDPFSLAHFNMEKCPPLAAPEHVSLFQGSACALRASAPIIFSGPFQYFKISASSCSRACFFIPRTTIFSGQFQYFKMTTFSCISTCITIPRTIILSGLL